MRVPIRPQVGVFGVFEAVDYKQWFALAEFVDNSIQSALDLWHAHGRRGPLHVSIRRTGGDGGTITVTDDAGGIPSHRFMQAFEVGTPPPDRSGLSVYGMGMKSAAAWFAGRVRITTTAIGEPVERTVEFDFPAIIANGLQDLEVVERPAPAEDHRTSIVMSNLRNPIRTKTHGKVRDHLRAIYRHFIRSGALVLSYDGETLTYEEPEVLVEPYYRDGAEAKEWRKEIDFTLSSGEHVRGFAALSKVGRTAGAGFSLFRQNRVITGLDDDPWRPSEIFGAGNSFRSQRVFGELHLDDVKVTYSKNGFVWQASEEELISRLREELDAEPLPLLRQAEGYRARKATSQQLQAAKKAMNAMDSAFAKAVEQDLPERIEDSDGPGPVAPPMAEPTLVTVPQPIAAPVDERVYQTMANGTSWEIVLRLTDQGDEWISLTEIPKTVDPAPKRLVVEVNVSSAFMRNFSGRDAVETESVLRVAAGVALTIVTARDHGVKNSMYVLHTLNQLMSGSLGIRS
ncbi:ATP-binding protein [Lentzea waywayandensis]|uniref:ATP-binding protein n=1 Tax=Lentzea waywayandensis TaxID=84724 RepID=UPI000B8466A8|nr:ATP-binding protein [Lentzea waywayandensis]